MKQLLLVLTLLLFACGGQELYDPDMAEQAPSNTIQTPNVTESSDDEHGIEGTGNDSSLDERVHQEDKSSPEDIVIGGEVKPAPKKLPDDVGPLICLKLQNITTPTPEAIGNNAALSLAVGTDDTKPGVYDLGYLLPNGLFRIGRQGLDDPVAVSLKLRGPGGIQSEPMNITIVCDNRTYRTRAPAMDEDTIFYLDQFARLYWRDTDHDGTGTAMPWELALVPEHRVN